MTQQNDTQKSSANQNKDSVPTLEACPFCPYPTERYFAVREVGWKRDREITRRVVTVCSECGAQGPAFGVMSFNNEGTAAQYWNRRATVADSRVSANGVAPTVDDGISWSALLSALERLRSKNRNPDNEWYHGWNAAIQCVINDINARSVTTTAAPVEHVDESPTDNNAH